LQDEPSDKATERLSGLMEMILGVRASAKAGKDWATSDRIRDELANLGILVKDGKDNKTEWEIAE
jgi:cysteinyl-tRNA synthetase